MSEAWRPTASLHALKQRDALMRALREYFQASNSLEVQTPSMSAAATTDPYIDSFNVSDAGKTLWLHTSPEFPMKRILAAYGVDIHQVATVYRQNESGRHHNREFALLEWYRVGFTLESLIQEASAIINTVAVALGQSARSLRVISYQDAVKELCGVYPDDLTLEHIARVFSQKERSFPDSLGVEVNRAQAREDALTLLVDEFIVNAFDDDKITALTDYPASQASLARTDVHISGQVVARRAEMFIGSVELANGFEELTDAAEQKGRFESDNQQRIHAGRPTMPIDSRLIDALSHGLPDCAGMAMGLDRLLMVLVGVDELADVVAFPGAHA